MNILISACLLGVECRYDGRGALDLTLVREFENGKINLIPVCPEVLGGLSIPRVPCERAGEKVVGKDGTDYTKQFEKGAEETLKLAHKHNCKYAVLKDRSPSCGLGRIYDGTFTGRLTDGSGVTAELLTRHGIRVLSESQAVEFFKAPGLHNEITISNNETQSDIDKIVKGRDNR